MAASNGSVKLVDRHKLNQISAVHPCCIYNYSFWNWGPDFSNPTWLDLLSVGSLMGAIPHKWELLQSGWIYSSFGLSSFGFTIRCKHVGYVVVPSSYMWIDCKDAGSKLDCKCLDMTESLCWHIDSVHWRDCSHPWQVHWRTLRSSSIFLASQWPSEACARTDLVWLCDRENAKDSWPDLLSRSFEIRKTLHRWTRDRTQMNSHQAHISSQCLLFSPGSFIRQEVSREQTMPWEVGVDVLLTPRVIFKKYCHKESRRWSFAT